MHLRRPILLLATTTLLPSSLAHTPEPRTFVSATATIMSKRTNEEISSPMNGDKIKLWDGSDKETFGSLDHPGYSVDSDPATFLGGWHAHREVWNAKEDGSDADPCWIKDEVMDMITQYEYDTMPIGRAPRILVLYGSLRPTSFSRKCAYEFARLLDLLGCDVRVYNPRGLPVRDPALEAEPKVQELRALTHWSDGHMWVSKGHNDQTGSYHQSELTFAFHPCRCHRKCTGLSQVSLRTKLTGSHSILAPSVQPRARLVVWPKSTGGVNPSMPSMSFDNSHVGCACLAVPTKVPLPRPGRSLARMVE